MANPIKVTAGNQEIEIPILNSFNEEGDKAFDIAEKYWDDLPGANAETVNAREVRKTCRAFLKEYLALVKMSDAIQYCDNMVAVRLMKELQGFS